MKAHYEDKLDLLRAENANLKFEIQKGIIIAGYLRSDLRMDSIYVHNSIGLLIADYLRFVFV